MTRRPRSTLAALTLVGAVLLPPAPASAAGTTPDTSDPVAGSTTAAPARHVVTLVTGDRVAVSSTPDGRPTVTVLPGSGGMATATVGAGGDPAADGFQVLAAGPHLYVIPQHAAGSIGAPLDLSLFDVNALIAGGYADATKPLDIAVTSEPGAQPAPLPGMDATAPGALRQPRARANAFGAALRGRSQAVAHGQPAGHLFDGIARLALAGQAAGTTVPPGQPAGQLYTLKVKVFDRAGHRVTGALASAMNANDTDSFIASQASFNGELSFSVPAGTYSIDSYVGTDHPDGSYDFSLVTEPNVAVTHDTVVVLDARKATRVGAGTPDPTTQLTAQLDLQRTPVTGPSFTTSFLTFGATPLYATPTDPVTVGSLYFYPSMRLGDADGGTDRYVYDLEFPYVGAIPADLDPVLQHGQLTAIDSRYHSPRPGRAEFDARAAVMPWQADIALIGAALAAPLARTEYVLPAPDMRFLHSVVEDADSDSGYLADVVRQYQPGQRVTEEWAAAPMVPGVEQQPTVAQQCPACRSGDRLLVGLWPYTDSGGHRELPGPDVTTAVDLFTNGTPTAHASSGFADLALSPDPAEYRLVLDATSTAPWRATATHTRTEWTFPSARRAADPLPAGWTCAGKGGGGRAAPDPAGAGSGDGCSFEPLLFPTYRPDAGTNDVIAAGGPAGVAVAVSHQRGAAPSPVTALDAAVSFDDGATWAPVPARRDGDGRYTLTYTQPALSATSGFASLRLTASDAAGSRVSQTVTRAYPLSVPPPPAAGATGSDPAPGTATGPRPACAGPAAAPYARCMALVGATAAPAGSTDAAAPTGYGPADVRSAYRLPADQGEGRVVAIVDAYDNPNAEADLNTYRAHYGLPPCTSADGCFRKVNQRGAAAPLPAPDPGWGLEIDLDIQAVSAACPRCRILLVEADSSSLNDLGPGVRAAVDLGADVVSNSYGSNGEFSGEQYFERYYQQRGVPIIVSSGDYGYGNGLPLVGGVSYPAASQYVVAVGGTSLRRADNTRGWTESAWEGATSGCSAYIHKPGWQKDTLCGKRTVADVAAVADPATGLAVYDSYGWWGGWLTVGGTSAAAPVVASVYAMADSPSADRYASDLYRDPGALFDVVDGSNGSCAGTYLCTGTTGYDGPTGLGTPNGTVAF